jgi:hypothetical protein
MTTVNGIDISRVRLPRRSRLFWALMWISAAMLVAATTFTVLGREAAPWFAWPLLLGVACQLLTGIMLARGSRGWWYLLGAGAVLTLVSFIGALSR